jgi:ATP synthase protein I
MSLPGDGDQDGHEVSPESSERLKRRLRDIDRRLKTKFDERKGISDEERGRRSTALGKALRLSTELVAGVFVGGLIGWLLDRWLKTLPLFLIVFLLLGIAAGLLNAVREAQKMGEK